MSKKYFTDTLISSIIIIVRDDRLQITDIKGDKENDSRNMFSKLRKYRGV